MAPRSAPVTGFRRPPSQALRWPAAFSVSGAGTGRSDLFQAGAFVRDTRRPAYISAALSYGWQDIATDRIVAAAGADMLRAEFGPNTFTGRVEGGYRFVALRLGSVGLTLYAAERFTAVDFPAYGERSIGRRHVRAVLCFEKRD
jgi:uncharacterized protein YhjY with autotransporter beta-barrel domain